MSTLSGVWMLLINDVVAGLTIPFCELFLRENEDSYLLFISIFSRRYGGILF